MIALGLTDIGDRKKALKAVEEIAGVKNYSIEKMAKEIFDLSCRKIISAVNEMLSEINNKPVYTIQRNYLEKGKRINYPKWYMS